MIEFDLIDVFADRQLSGNGVSVFFGWRKGEVLQAITREMRQYESIFLKCEGDSRAISARIFTLEEELPFAGHPLLGAASALHLRQGVSDEMSWAFQLPMCTVEVKTKRLPGEIFASMRQESILFLPPLSPEEVMPFLDALNLKSDQLINDLPLRVVSAGLPYLIIPIRGGLESVRVARANFEKLLAKVGAKFSYVFDVDRREGRSFDNAGSSEDIATGSAAGPVGAYLVKYGMAEVNAPIQIQQGRFLNRPSIMEVLIQNDERKKGLSALLSGSCFLTGTGQLFI